MSFAIMRLAKLKTWSAVSSSSSHTYRTRLTLNADPEKLALNKTGKGSKGDVLRDVRKRVEEVTTKPRSNAVLALEFLLSASPEWFEGKSNAEINEWANASTGWLKDVFGSKNVVHVVMHNDESTPHLVAYVVPEKDKRLNSKGYIGSPELMSNLQTSYAEAVSRFDLQRGLKGSKAQHTTVKDWYGHINKASEKLVEAPAPLDPPEVSWMMPRARSDAVNAWRSGEKKVRQDLIKAAAKSVLEVSIANNKINELKDDNASLSSQLETMRDSLSQAYASLNLTKEEVSSLRRSNTTLIAQRLGYFGVIEKNENAIDFIKRVAGFDYQQTIAWLHAELGPVITGSIVARSSAQANEPRPFTRVENIIKEQVSTQLDALDCDNYRLTLMSYDPSKKPFLPGKRGKESTEIFYTKQDVIDAIPFLRTKNNQDMNILITPISDSYYILLDDSKLSLEELKDSGFKPCLVQSTSYDSTQAVFKVPSNLNKNYVLALFNELNKSLGDERITGLRHPFRLAGFRNLKPKHLRDGLYPFVKIISAVNVMCQKCINLVKDIELSTYAQLQQQEEKSLVKRYEPKN